MGPLPTPFQPFAADLAAATGNHPIAVAIFMRLWRVASFGPG